MDTVNRIRNCVVNFRRVCPETWERLSPTQVEGVKFCGTCSRQVFLCETAAAVLEHALSGQCIAKPMPNLSGLPITMTVGEPEVTPPQPTPAARLLREEP